VVKFVTVKTFFENLRIISVFIYNFISTKSGCKENFILERLNACLGIEFN